MERALDEPSAEFSPPWAGGETWTVDYRFVFEGTATRPDPPPTVERGTWDYSLTADGETGNFVVNAANRARFPPSWSATYKPTGELHSMPHFVGAIPLARNAPYLNPEHQPSWGVIPWWPLFPLAPGSTLSYMDGAITQSVVDEGNALLIHVTAKQGIDDPYPLRHMKMRWKKDDPWWETVELFTEQDGSSGLGAVQAAGSLVRRARAEVR